MAATPPETSVIEHELRVAARPETVFAFFTDPSKMVRWMGDEATLDPRPGGLCRVGFGAAPAMLGEYVEVVPYTRVVFSWGWETNLLPVPPASTIVEVSLTPEGEGTRVRLNHRRLPSTTLEFHRTGWRHYFGRLEIAAAGGDPGADTLPERMGARS